MQCTYLVGWYSFYCWSKKRQLKIEKEKSFSNHLYLHTSSSFTKYSPHIVTAKIINAEIIKPNCITKLKMCDDKFCVSLLPIGLFDWISTWTIWCVSGEIIVIEIGTSSAAAANGCNIFALYCNIPWDFAVCVISNIDGCDAFTYRGTR